MNKLILSIAVLAALTACSKEEAKTKSNDEVIKETISSDDFKNLDKDSQAIVLRALSDKEGTGSTEVANNDTSGNMDDTELTPEEQAMDDGSGLTAEDNGQTIHFGNGWTLFKEGTTNFEIRKIVEEAGPVYRYMGDIDGNRVTMVFTCARPTKPATSVVLFAMANGNEFSSAGVESFPYPEGKYRYISMGPNGGPARSGNMPNGTLEIVASADLNKNTIDVNYRDFDSLVLRNKNKFTHSSDMSNKNFISRWYNGQYDNMYLGRFSEAENAVLTGQATELPEINGKVNQTKPILVSSIPKLTVGDGKIFNKHPCNFF